LTPDFWGKHKIDDHPFEAHTKALNLQAKQDAEPKREENERDRPRPQRRNY